MFIVVDEDRNGYITKEEAEEAKQQPLRVKERLRGPEYAAATYFVQELRRQLITAMQVEPLRQLWLTCQAQRGHGTLRRDTASGLLHCSPERVPGRLRH